MFVSAQGIWGRGLWEVWPLGGVWERLRSGGWGPRAEISALTSRATREHAGMWQAGCQPGGEPSLATESAAVQLPELREINVCHLSQICTQCSLHTAHVMLRSEKVRGALSLLPSRECMGWARGRHAHVTNAPPTPTNKALDFQATVSGLE